MKRIVTWIAFTALLLGLAACGPTVETSEDMEAHEFLCEFAEPSRRLKSESGFWYYLNDEGKIFRWAPMEDVAENWVEQDVVFELAALENEGDIIYLSYSLTNGMDNTLEPLGDVEIAVLLTDGWYIMPNVPGEDFGEKLKTGESREAVIEVGTLQKSYLPNGHYRIQLKIDELSYAYVEFDMENTAGEMRMTAG